MYVEGIFRAFKNVEGRNSSKNPKRGNEGGKRRHTFAKRGHSLVTLHKK